MDYVRHAFREGFAKGLFLRYALMGLAKAHVLSRRFVYDWSLVDRPHYAFGLLHSATEARCLGHRELTAIEFGVAGGNGLLAMEAYAADISDLVGIKIHVVGFDTGTGLPAPEDYRDIPYLWAPGDFDMDVSGLRSRLRSASLRLGPISETLPTFMREVDAKAPIGFVAIDVDLWSSTRDCLTMFDSDSYTRLPRVWCYFDDIIGTIPDIGELLAIDEFNAANETVKIRQPFNLRTNIPLQPAWAEQMWQAHSFHHPDYTRLLVSSKDRELPLAPH
jgi:hypothetical protein